MLTLVAELHRERDGGAVPGEVVRLRVVRAGVALAAGDDRLGGELGQLDRRLPAGGDHDRAAHVGRAGLVPGVRAVRSVLHADVVAGVDDVVVAVIGLADEDGHVGDERRCVRGRRGLALGVGGAPHEDETDDEAEDEHDEQRLALHKCSLLNCGVLSGGTRRGASTFGNEDERYNNIKSKNKQYFYVFYPSCEGRTRANSPHRLT